MNILTFDLEDWYCHDDYSQDFDWDKHENRLYEGTDRILDQLDKHSLKATFFCVGWIAEKHPQIIRKIANNGHHIGCHSYQHELATRFTPSEFKADTLKAKMLLENVAGCEVDAFRVPSFSITKSNFWTFDILMELGFKYDCSVFPSNHEFGGIPDFPKAEPTLLEVNGAYLKEFPINLGQLLGQKIIYSGGGYFRIIPYLILKSMIKKSPYVMSYFHPSDFDPGQPKMPQLSKMRQFKNRVALKGAFDKFQKLLVDFQFVNLHQADKLINWDNANIYKITL